MKLHEAITNVLEIDDKPLTSLEIAAKLNANPAYRQENGRDFLSSQIQTCLDNFPSHFQGLNGKTVLVKNQKWKDLISSHLYIINILRVHYSGEKLSFIAAVLFFYKWTLDFKIHKMDQINDIIDKFPRLVSGETNLWLKSLYLLDQTFGFPIKIFEQLGDLIESLSIGEQEEIIRILTQFNSSDFTAEERSIAFEYMIHLDIAGQYKTAPTGTPYQVIQLMAMLLKPRGGVVFDPVCGVGGLLTETLKHTKSDLTAKGMDVNPFSACLAFISLFLLGLSDPDIRIKNCFSELETRQKYDYIIADLPFEPARYSDLFFDLADQWQIKFPKRGKGFSAMVLLVLSKLSARGKAVLTVSDTFLSSGGVDSRVRSILLEDDLIESIISLPANGLKPYANGKASILVLNRAKPSYLLNKIKLIDAGLSSINLTTQNYSIEAIASAYDEKYPERKNVSIVSLDEVKRAETLRVSSFTDRLPGLDSQIMEGKAARLGDLVEMRRGVDLFEKDDANHDAGIPYIKIENLGRDILEVYLSSENLVNFIDDKEKYSKSLISEPVLLVARIGPTLKPTYFKPNKKVPSVVAHSNVIVLRPLRTTRVDLEYIYYQLYSTFVQRQISEKRHGTVMPYISIQGLQSLVVPYMEVSAQKDFVLTQRTNIIASERERVEQKLKLLGYEDQEIRKESDVVSTLVHELRPKLLRLNTFSKKLNRIIDKRKLHDFAEYDDIGVPDNDYLIEDIVLPENKTISVLAKSLEDDSDQLNRILTRVQKVMGFNLDPKDFVETDLIEFLSEYFEKK